MSKPATAVILFEDPEVMGLRPLVHARPAFELRTGALNLRERASLAFPDRPLVAWVRPSLQPLLALTLPELSPSAQRAGKGLALLLNARLRASVAALRALGGSVPPRPCVHRWRDSVAAAWIASEDLPSDPASDLQALWKGLPAVDPPADLALFEHPWDLVLANADDLRADFQVLAEEAVPARRIFGVTFETDAEFLPLLESFRYGGPERTILYPGVHLIAADNIRFGPDAVVKPGCVLDAEGGPILVGAGVRLQANCTVEGPCHLGPGTLVHPGTRLREGCSVGALCKVGGEVEETVVSDLSNKQHDGFLGHGYLGSWVNLGAGTSCSDLKNNYSTVRVDLGEGPVDTGERLVGPTFGDHAKTGIQTMLTTGAVVGVAANVFGAGFPPRFVPSFAWGGAGGWTEHRLEDALATARTVLARRRAAWSPAYETLLRHIHTATAAER